MYKQLLIEQISRVSIFIDSIVCWFVFWILISTRSIRDRFRCMERLAYTCFISYMMAQPDLTFVRDLHLLDNIPQSSLNFSFFFFCLNTYLTLEKAWILYFLVDAIMLHVRSESYVYTKLLSVPIHLNSLFSTNENYFSWDSLSSIGWRHYPSSSL
jgi:hypothetical protein